MHDAIIVVRNIQRIDCFYSVFLKLIIEIIVDVAPDNPHVIVSIRSRLLVPEPNSMTQFMYDVTCPSAYELVWQAYR